MKCMWQNWLNGALGIAVMLVAFLGSTDVVLMWTLGAIGMIIAIVGFWGGVSSMHAGSSETTIEPT